MSQRRSRAPSRSSDDSTSSPRIPPVPRGGGRRTGGGGGHRASDEITSSPKRRRRHSGRGYDMPREKQPPPHLSSNKVKLQFCVFHGTPSHCWRTVDFTLDRRDEDREVWEDIRQVYRNELQGVWRRIYGFRKLKKIIPVEYTTNNVPNPRTGKDDPTYHSFMHALNHPHHIHSKYEWVDWFTDFKASERGKPVGLEFQEGLWAEKLAIIAILITVAIVVVSIVWAVKGGQLQTVFTVMGFVLTGAAAEIALVALYFQVTQTN